MIYARYYKRNKKAYLAKDGSAIIDYQDYYEKCIERIDGKIIVFDNAPVLKRNKQEQNKKS